MRKAVTLFLLLGLSTGAAAQQAGDRAGTWEVGFVLSNTTSETLLGEGGSSLEIDSEIGFGGVGTYNVTDRFAMQVEANWSQPGYVARLPVDGTASVATIDAALDVATILFKGIFYFSESDFSPYIEVGAGWTRLDTNIADGPPTAGGCWWDPWWGYTCTQYYETYHDTRASYTTAFGVRWDMTADTLLKLSWGLLHMDTGTRTEEFSQDIFRADFSWKF